MYPGKNFLSVVFFDPPLSSTICSVGIRISPNLSDKYPEHKTEFDKLVDLCGKARELQGVHYPSDNEAAKKIIETIYPPLKKYYIGVGHEL